MISARWILPVVDDPIEGGWIRLQDNRIVEIGASNPPADATDLGDVAILPGLVNAHTHLEFSDLDSPVGQQNTPLSAWIGEVVKTRQIATETHQQDAIDRGLQEVAACGTRLVGEIATPPCQYSTRQRTVDVISFAEVLGLSPERARERLQAAMAHDQTRSNSAISPHAPYSTTRDTIHECIEFARARDVPLAMHVAESPDERLLLVSGEGPFAESLQRMGVWKPGLFPWGPDPLSELIDQLSRAPRALLIHGNDLKPNEINRVRQHDQVSVVYCPRTHAFFGYDPHPVDQLTTAGVNVALGTDSRASNPDLNLWGEVQFLLNHRQDLPPASVLRMATANGARALGYDRIVGRLAVGYEPGLGCVSTDSATIDGVYDCLAKSEYRCVE